MTRMPMIDKNPIMRYLHLYCFGYIAHLSKSKSKGQNEDIFPQPRFKMFQPIKKLYSGNTKDRLFRNLLFTYKQEILGGAIITIFYVVLNLMIPQLIKQFMEYIKEQDQFNNHEEMKYITEKYVIIQLLRTIFNIHMRRVFDELAIKIESTLSMKLAKKALLMKKEDRKAWPETEILHFENVDLKLIHNLFRYLFYMIEIPVTIVIALGLLFIENVSYGIIGSYWFLIVFLIQRGLEEKMKECNLTKFELIEKRSKLNYEMIDKIKLAKISKSENLLIEKNNELFLEENHDHHLFYRYSTLFDITQIMLPIAVVISISIFDYNHQTPFTVQQVYVMLSLLGICYHPMKNFRTFQINLSDGLIAMRKLTIFFDMPEDRTQHNPSKYTEIIVAKDTMAQYTTESYFMEQQHSKNSQTNNKVIYQNFRMILDVKHHIELKSGDRLVVLGRKGQGTSTFLHFLMGELNLMKGALRIGKKVSYFSEVGFFINDTIAENFRFYNKECNLERIKQVYKDLGLEEDLKLMNGIDEIVEKNKFTDHQLKKIAFGRIFCSNSDVLILDSPFIKLNKDFAQQIEKILRKKQKQGKIIVLTAKAMDYFEAADRILIINMAQTIQYSTYEKMINDEHSGLKKFLKISYDVTKKTSLDEVSRIARQFQIKVYKALTMSALLKKQQEIEKNKQVLSRVLQNLSDYSFELAKEIKATQMKEQILAKDRSIEEYFKKFLSSAPFKETIYILIIIVVAELLHVFIHFFIGHEYEHHLNEGLASLKGLMMYELILTLGLCAVIFLEGEVSSHLAVIQGNRLYKQALRSVCKKPIKWYNTAYSLQLAEKFNHDYQEIFIAFHGSLNIFKNAVIFIITIQLISGNNKLLIISMSLIVAACYYLIFRLLRRNQEKIDKHYYIFKYEFVKALNQIIQGSTIIKIYSVREEVLKKIQQKYLKLASYKLAVNFTSYGQSLLCDFASLIVTAVALEYGIGQKSKHSHQGSQALIATSIILLMNLSDVMKVLVNLSVQFQSFFRINLLPFMEMVNLKEESTPEHVQMVSENMLESSYSRKSHRINYAITFNKVLLQEKGDILFQNYPLSLKIEEGEHIAIVQTNEVLRQNLLYGLTKNLASLYEEKSERGIYIGENNIIKYHNAKLREIIGVIQEHNFFLSGTLKDNISWGSSRFDEKQALKYAELLDFSLQIQQFLQKKLQCFVQSNITENSYQFTKKLALLRILVRKPKIVIIKDTSSFLSTWDMVGLLMEHVKGCTIIKISEGVEEAFDMSRIVYLENMKLREEGVPKILMDDRLSWLGDRLRQSNMKGYLYMNKISKSPTMLKRNHTTIN